MPLLEGISPLGLIVATLLPWCAGAVVVRSLLGRAHVAVVLGHGYVVGQLVVMLLLLAWHAMGLKLAFVPLALLLGAATLAGAVILGRIARPVRMSWPRRQVLCQALWLVPLLWFLGERGGALLQELMLRPLSAWDAWMNWVPRAVVWFHHGELTPFGLPSAWLAAAPDTELYTLGNWRAGDYPPGVPLSLLWQMLGAGTHDHTLLYLPWLLLPGACALALWGHLRLIGLGAAATALAVYALLSQPLLNIHAVFAGYADLWVAVCFGLGAMALAQWQHDDQPRYAALAALMALLCTLLKTPGLVFAVLLVGGMVLLAWRPSPRWLLWAGAVSAGALSLGLLAGMHPRIAAAATDFLVLELPGTLPTLRIQPSPLLPYLRDSLFVHANWHLLWPLLGACLLAGYLTRGVQSLHSIALLLLASGMALLLVVFGFTQYFLEAENGVTFNRTVLYLVPLAVYVAFAQLPPLLQPSPAAADART